MYTGIAKYTGTTYTVPTQGIINPTPILSLLKITSLKLWLDAADVTGTGTNPAPGNLTTWVDKSGTGNGTAANGFGVLAASPARVTFSGGPYYSVPTINATPTAETVFVVTSTTFTTELTFLSGSVDGSRTLSQNIPSSGNVYVSAWNVLGQAVKSGAPTNGTLFLTTFVFGSGSSQMFVNGVGGTSVATSFSGTSTSYVGNHPGFDAKSFKGSMYEVLIYNTALSTTDRQTIETYLRSKWGF
jgi:hypothetical protein